MIHAWRDEKEVRCEELGHRARRDKELVYSPQGTLEHAPPDMPGSPQHGRVQGFKAAGFYFGEADWVRRQLTKKAASMLAPLDHVDQLRDVGDVGGVRPDQARDRHLHHQQHAPLLAARAAHRLHHGGATAAAGRGVPARLHDGVPGRTVGEVV